MALYIPKTQIEHFGLTAQESQAGFLMGGNGI